MMSRIAQILAVAICVAFVQSLHLASSDRAVAQGCTNSSCGVDECCADSQVHGNVCEKFRKQGEGCHQPNHGHHTIIYHCGCLQGLTCQHISLSQASGHHNHDHDLISAEELLEQTGLGICM